MKKLTFVSILINAVLISYLCYPRIKKKLKSPDPKIKIVMYGDSMTEQGNWAIGLERNDIKNSGAGGAKTSDLLLRLHDSVIKYRPDTCFLQAGINDIRNLPDLTQTKINYKKIIEKLLNEGIFPVVISTIYIKKDIYQDEINEVNINLGVDSLNAYLISVCNANKILFIDVNSRLTKDGKLWVKYSVDGIHLNKKGYEVWYSEINKRTTQ